MSDLPTAPVLVTRECTATLVPSGAPITLQYGQRVIVTQAYGGSFTVRLAQGQLAHLDARNGEALDLPTPPGVGDTARGPDAVPSSNAAVDPAAAGSALLTARQVLEQLKTVFDPEIPVNIVDLGLIYDCAATPLPAGGYRVAIQMSMTAPGCGMGDVLRAEAQTKAQAVPGVREVDVEVVWEPPWTPQRMSIAARLQLGMM